jgi:hypothetical protein
MRPAHGRWRPRPPSAADWLELLASDGPFLAAPVVKEVWSTGLPALDHDSVTRLRDASALLDASPGTRDGFVRTVLTDFLGWGDRLALAPNLPPGLTTPVPEHATQVRPDFALLAAQGEKPALLGMLTTPGTRATSRTAAAHATASTWTASPVDRLAHALRFQGVPLGLVTDGSEWTLGCLPGGALTTVTWTRHVWFDEPETLRAFHALLCRQRFFGVEDERTLPALLGLSLDRQEEITERLKEQSQAVVDMLVATIGRLDAEHHARHGRGLLPETIEPSDVYAAAVTVLMRLVFLLYAEEQGLLPLDDDAYASAYAASTLASSLRETATESGEDALERSTTGWHRLLAASRAIHRGARHQDLSLPAYGGSLFDPDRFPWLEGRFSASDPLEGALPVPIDDRTILHSLDALQWLRFGRERRRISFRQLDVEQIGYVYEGLIGEDATRSDGWVLGVASDTRGERDGPELALHDMELKLEDGPDEFAEWLSPLTQTAAGRRSERSIVKTLLAEADDRLWREVLEACGGDEAAARAVLPFGRLLRRDPRDLPVVYPPRSLYLTDSVLRAHTGAVYTPRNLAEQVVIGALEPLVYSPGPLDTENQADWRLLPPGNLLGLRVIDIAAGSGAFLVAATRYLARRLIESRELHDGVPIEPEPDDAAAQELEARRAVLDHCIYGVDINPMAVEMCKLSLWLVTLDRQRPFTFLDDRISVGDSLIGITGTDQLVDLHMGPEVGRRLQSERLPLWRADVASLLEEATRLRERLADIPLIDTRSAEDKARLLRESQAVTDRLSRIANALSAASLLGGSEANYDLAIQLAEALTGASGLDPAALEERTSFALTDRSGRIRQPAHFPLLFPEVFRGIQPGFDAVIGNPPYLGGQKITGIHGTDYRDHLVRQRGRGVRGSADLVAYMLLTAAAITRRDHGELGLITTNTIAQGGTREVGLDQLVQDGLDLHGAVKSAKWPTRAVNLEYSIVWATHRRRGSGVRAVSDGTQVAKITASLDPSGRVDGNPERLVANRGIAFQGSIVLGLGFTMSEAEARALIQRDPRNAEVLFPYLNGEDLNSRPDCSASRWVVNFFDWPEERAQEYPECWATVEEKVRPERALLMGRNATATDRARHWWRYGRRADGLYLAIAHLDRVLAITLVSKVVLPVFVPTGQVFAHRLAVFATDDAAHLAAFSWEGHRAWAVTWSSTLETRVNYAPSDVVETYPLPTLTPLMRVTGKRLDEERRQLMLNRNLGLTAAYNLVHDPVAQDDAVKELRTIHVAIDEAVCEAYGWTDLVLGHGHHETRQGTRWTIAPAVQQEILDRLLELNHERHAEEQRSGGSANRPRRGGRKAVATAPGTQAELFAEGAV